MRGARLDDTQNRSVPLDTVLPHPV
jgi:hypothetical protein